MKYKYDQSAERDFKRSAIFKSIPKGIIISDTYNNEWFPFSIVDIDNNKFNLRLIKDEFHRKFGGSTKEDIFMPWHYTVEFVGKNYNVSSSRPIMYKSLIPGYEDYISVFIIGNSKNDLYTKELYNVIAHMVLNSLRLLPGWRLDISDKIIYHNLGNNFDEKLLKMSLR